MDGRQELLERLWATQPDSEGSAVEDLSEMRKAEAAALSARSEVQTDDLHRSRS